MEKEIPKQKIKLMTAKEVADILGVSLRTIHYYKKKHGLGHYKIGGKLLFSEDDIKLWIKSCHKQK